jgi:hypothetical protein
VKAYKDSACEALGRGATSRWIWGIHSFLMAFSGRMTIYDHHKLYVTMIEVGRFMALSWFIMVIYGYGTIILIYFNGHLIETMAT